MEITTYWSKGADQDLYRPWKSNYLLASPQMIRIGMCQVHWQENSIIITSTELFIDQDPRTSWAESLSAYQGDAGQYSNHHDIQNKINPRSK